MPPPPPPSQPPARRRHLTAAERAAIVQERAQGVRVQDLAQRWGVSRQAIHATFRRTQDAEGPSPRPSPSRPGSRTVSVRVSLRELGEIDAAAARWGVSRPDAVRRLMASAEAILAPDKAGAAQLAPITAAVREVGGHVNRIAQACNEARMWRQPIPYTAGDHAHVRRAVAVVFEVVGQVQGWALAQHAQQDGAAAAALGAKRERKEPRDGQ